jgi:hypothetical protein
MDGIANIGFSFLVVIGSWEVENENGPEIAASLLQSCCRSTGFILRY